MFWFTDSPRAKQTSLEFRNFTFNDTVVIDVKRVLLISNIGSTKFVDFKV